MSGHRSQVMGYRPFNLWQLLIVNCSLLIGFSACSPSYKAEVDAIVLKPAPTFQADSAYAHLATQVGFGPRIPGTETHARCGDFLVSKLRQYGATVTEQHDSVTVFESKRLPMRNIIGSFFPEKKDRILLVAHWDSRHVSDEDKEHYNEPISGAHDGASGVAVLLEVARLLGKQQPNVGVDIILFDTEDQGRTWQQGDPKDPEFFFCMGARHWVKQPHVAGYTARYGILLDMVAAKDAVFTLEQISMHHAAPQMRNAWAIAHRLGHEEQFPFNLTRQILHDHYYINNEAGIPTFSIVQHDNTTRSGYGAYWHTHNDNLGTIDRGTMQAVGEVVVQVLYNEE
jgi:hypothetical protein